MALILRRTLLAIAIAAFAVVVQAQDEDEVIAVDSSIVLLNAAVFDKAGNPVTGLRKEQFKIYEDGVEQPIGLFAAEETPFAAVILLDTSGSMEQRISMARSAAIRFLEGLRVDDNAAIYHFDAKIHPIQDFSNSRDISESVFDIKSRGMTALYDAIYKAATELEKRPEKRKAIIVLSDGGDTASGKSAEKALRAALAADAVIYTVDMSTEEMSRQLRGMNQAILRGFAEKTGGTFVATPGGSAMREAFENIVGELGVQYTLGYQPLNAKKDGKWRSINLVVSRPNLTIRTRKGYNAEKNR